MRLECRGEEAGGENERKSRLTGETVGTALPNNAAAQTKWKSES